MRKSRKLLIFSLFLCHLAGAYTIGSFSLPLGGLKNPGAGFYPLLIGFAFLAVGTTLFLRSYSSRENEDDEEAFPVGKDLKRVLSLAIVLIVFAFIFKPLGYGISSGILMVAVLRVLGMQNWPRIIGISLVTSIFSNYLFTSILGVPLPKCTLFS
jgi:putative tricarboxylic transport membrane protein